MKHIYEWLDEKENLTTEAELKVWEYLDWKTLPAFEMYRKVKDYDGLKVYCMYNNIKYRIICASRLGDVWLKLNTPELENENDPHGYDLRVDITDCFDFSFTDNRK